MPLSPSDQKVVLIVDNLKVHHAAAWTKSGVDALQAGVEMAHDRRSDQLSYGRSSASVDAERRYRQQTSEVLLGSCLVSGSVSRPRRSCEARPWRGQNNNSAKS